MGTLRGTLLFLLSYLYYLVYQTWSCTLVQVSVVQSSASTPSTSVSPPPPPPPHTHTMLAGKRAGVSEKSLCMGEPLPIFFFSVLTWSFSNFPSMCIMYRGTNALVYKFVQVFGWELFKHLIGGAPSRSAQSYQPL